MREDGRNCTDFREYWIETGNLVQANGSCRIVFPDSDLEIVIGVKCSVDDCKNNEN